MKTIILSIIMFVAGFLLQPWLLKIKLKQTPLTCRHCNQPIRGLKDAPEIPIHIYSETRSCIGSSTNMAEYHDHDKKAAENNG